MEKEIKAGPLYFKTMDSRHARVIAHQGGTRSGKTYSILQYLIARAMQGERLKITIARKSYTWLQNSVLQDFFDLLHAYGLYNPAAYHKTNHTYMLNGTRFWFVGLSESQKLRGCKQDIFWLNEANECSLDNFRQAIFRTPGQVILDYNPSARHHWIYDDVLMRPDCVFIQSTYLDNPFLEQELVSEIEAMEETSPDYWLVFGLGQRGGSVELILPTYKMVNQLPQGTTTAYGIDFGFNNPTALVRADYRDGELYLTECIYQSHLTLAQLIAKMQELNIPQHHPIYADSARPEYIQELKAAGFNTHAATKFVAEGLDRMRRCRLFVQTGSKNLTKELNNYCWMRDANGNLLDKPIKFMDHAIDAARYAAYAMVARPKRGAKASIMKLG
jgi:phage terminase large subunit